VPLILIARDAATRKLFERHRRAFEHLANAASVELRLAGEARPRKAAVHVEPEVEVHLPLEGLIDFAEERRRVEKELLRIGGELAGIEKRLGNEGFVARAPRDVVEKDRSRADELRGKREKLARHLARVTSPEGGMEENRPENKQPNQNSTPGQHDGGGEPGSGGQGGRGPDQMGTHGGPGSPGAVPERYPAQASPEDEDDEGAQAPYGGAPAGAAYGEEPAPAAKPSAPPRRAAKRKARPAAKSKARPAAKSKPKKAAAGKKGRVKAKGAKKGAARTAAKKGKKAQKRGASKAARKGPAKRGAARKKSKRG
jgi:valyl-tRNA synthetase